MEINQNSGLHPKFSDSLIASAQKVEFILENLKDHAIFMLNANGTICSWNAGSERVFGYGEAEAIGNSFSTIFTPEDVQAGIPEGELAVARSEGKAEDERWHQRKDGSRFWASGAVVPVPGGAGEGQFIKVVRDATDRKRAEDADRMESIGRLAGGVAHDYNNILTAVIGYAELLASATPKDSLQIEWVTEILAASNRAATLTRDLLAFSRRQMIAPKPINLNETLRNLQGRLRMILGERVQLSIHPDPDLENVLLDPEQIELVLVNLALNAHEAMPKGGVVEIRTLGAKAAAEAASGASDAGAATAASAAGALNAASAANGREIQAGPSGEASDAPTRDYISLIFRDNGKGMDAETSAHAFDPFFSTKPKSTGSVGLGLSTGYGIIQQSGGTISLKSVPDKGTEIEIHLPVFREEEIPSEPGTPVSAQVPATRPGNEDGRKRAILLVEDEPAVRKLASQIMRTKGFEVLEAKDGKEGLAIFQARPHAVDMVVTDVVMPKMGGLAMARSIFSLRPDIHVLFMSGYSDDSLSALNLPPGQWGFLQKPFSIAGLQAKIDAAIPSQPVEALATEIMSGS